MRQDIKRYNRIRRHNICLVGVPGRENRKKEEVATFR